MKSTIETPDATSPIVALTFSGTYNLFCCNKKGILYKYSFANGPAELVDQRDLCCKPSSFSASSDSLFYLFSGRLYQLNTYYLNSDPLLLSNAQKHNEVMVSPCGRAIATFTRNESNPFVWFLPFSEVNRFILPESRVIDFQWGFSQLLKAVTASANGNIRVWIESPVAKEMNCVAYFHFDTPIYSVGFCNPLTKWHQPQTFAPVSTNYSNIFPSITMPYLTIIVGTNELDKNTVILEENGTPNLTRIAAVNLAHENPIATICDTRNVYIQSRTKQIITATCFTINSLSFHQIEVSSNEITTFIPYNISFMTTKIADILSTSTMNNLLLQMTDKTIVNWNTMSITHMAPKRFAWKNEIYAVDKEKIICGENRFDFGFVSSFDFTSAESHGFITIALSSKQISVSFYDGKFKKLEIAPIPGEMTSATIHSTDLIAVCTTTTVHILFYLNRIFNILSSTDFPKPYASFLRHPIALLAVSTITSLKFFVVKRKGLKICKECLTEIPSTPIITLKYLDDTLYGATKHSLFRMIFNKDQFVHQLSTTDDFVFNTALSMCYFSVINERVNDRIPDFDSFQTKLEAESFVFKPSPCVPRYFSTFCEMLPSSWANVDNNGMKFLFYSILTKIRPDLVQFYPLFALWALKSTDQPSLIQILNFSSISGICDSYLPLWAKDGNTLKEAVKIYVNQKPELEDFDVYMLLCIAINKKMLASRMAKIFGEEKISSFLSQQKYTKKELLIVEKTAFKAQKHHRYAFAAMFFLMKNLKYQAVAVLKETPMLMILIARIVDEPVWPELIQTHFHDSFYSYYWNNKFDQAIETLKTDLPSCDFLSVELHRYELLHVFNKPDKSFLLNLQKIPYFIIPHLAYNQISHHVVDSTESESDSEEFAISSTPKAVEFNFGMKSWTTVQDSSEDEEEEDEEEEPKETKFKLTGVTIDEVINNMKIEEDFGFDIIKSFRLPLFESKPAEFIRPNREEHIVQLLCQLYNAQYDRSTIICLLELAEKLAVQEKTLPFVVAIYFSMSYALSETTWLTAFFGDSSRMVDYIPILVDHFRNVLEKEIVTSDPDILTKLVGCDYTCDRDDIKLANYLVFHRVMSTITNMLEEGSYPILLSFLHHRHRLLFEQLENTTFTNPILTNDLEAIGLMKCPDLVNKIHKSQNEEKWNISLNDPYISPFYIDSKFKFTSGYKLKSGTSTAFDICIDQLNNQRVAIAGKQLSQLAISQAFLNGSYNLDDMTAAEDDEWEIIEHPNDKKESTSFASPFYAKINQTPIIKDKYYIQRDFPKISWKSKLCDMKEVKARSIDNHPSSELFATGDSTGFLHMWRFGAHLSDYLIKVSDKRITSILFNDKGDRVAATDLDGTLFISNFDTTSFIKLETNSTFSWLNSDVQLISYNPKENNLSVYDTLAGVDPVIKFEMEKADDKKCPMSVSNSYVSVGLSNGTVRIFDIRMGQRIGKMYLHSDVITCLKYDPSGNFFVTGSRDNSMSIVEARTFTSMETIKDIFPDYNPNASKRGITSIATSNQAIVACGHSSYVYAWTVFEPYH